MAVLSRCAGAAQYIWGDWYVQYIVTPYLSETKVILAPPPPSKRGEGVRGREEYSAFRGKGGAVSRPHQREAAAMAGGVLGIQPHYDLLFFYPDQSGRTRWLRISDLLDNLFSFPHFLGETDL